MDQCKDSVLTSVDILILAIQHFQRFGFLPSISYFLSSLEVFCSSFSLFHLLSSLLMLYCMYCVLTNNMIAVRFLKLTWLFIKFFKGLIDVNRSIEATSYLH